MSTHFRIIGCLLSTSIFVSQARLGAFLEPGKDNEQHVVANLLAELKGGRAAGRVARLEKAVAPMFAALPRNTYGNLDHAVVRYALHRLFVQQHGWFVRGLEPSTEKTATAKLSEWIPNYLQEHLERTENGKGMSLHELVVLAATLEDLIHRETLERVEKVYGIMEFQPHMALDESDVRRVVDSFMTAYITGSNFSTITQPKLAETRQIFDKLSPSWSKTREWFSSVQSKVVHEEYPGQTSLEQPIVAHIVEEVVDQYGPYNDRECRGLKSMLLGFEHKKKGRVLLSDFYKNAKTGYWELDDKVEYLRALGALDESDKENTLVIVPNYVGAWPQCLKASSMYAVCCRNECEDLMGKLEKVVGGSHATAQEVIKVVTDLSTDTVTAPRKTSQKLSKRLDDIAEKHNGKVPLHGRLFAQWMHHAYPRECPFPHEAGTTSPQTPDQWMEKTGQDTTKASEEEMARWMREGPARKASIEIGAEGAEEDDADCQLPWSEKEELLVTRPSVQDSKTVQAGTNGTSPLEIGFIAFGLVGIWFLRKAWQSYTRATARTAKSEKCYA